MHLKYLVEKPNERYVRSTSVASAAEKKKKKPSAAENEVKVNQYRLRVTLKKGFLKLLYTLFYDVAIYSTCGAY